MGHPDKQRQIQGSFTAFRMTTSKQYVQDDDVKTLR
jgi:hypothetical protein